MKYKENTMAKLKVARLTDWGVFLDAGTGKTSDDILLHKDQQIKPLTLADEIFVFLYNDPKGRLTASMRLPRLRLGQIGYVETLNRTDFGAFVDLGTERGIFMPFAEMKGNLKEGDWAWVKLYQDKSGRLAVTMDVDEEICQIALPAENIEHGDIIEGSIYNMTEDGAFLITPQKWIAFLHRDEIDRPILVGERISGRVTYVREDGRLNISLREQKEKSIFNDSEKIMAELLSHDGILPYTDQSMPAVIRQKFGISKAAFKRALGHLMKNKKIKQDSEKIILIENKEEGM